MKAIWVIVGTIILFLLGGVCIGEAIEDFKNQKYKSFGTNAIIAISVITTIIKITLSLIS